MAVNKVEINGKPVIDLTQDTVTPESLKKGITAHSANGEKIVGTVELPPATGGGFNPKIFRPETPYGESMNSKPYTGGFILVPPFSNGFIFLNWDITANDDLDPSGNFTPEVVCVYIPSINVNKCTVMMLDLFDTGRTIAYDNWITYNDHASALDWTDAFKQNDYYDQLLWASKSGYSTYIIF